MGLKSFCGRYGYCIWKWLFVKSVLNLSGFWLDQNIINTFNESYNYQMSAKGKVGKSAKGGKGTGSHAKQVSRSTKAGLQFPVGRISRFLKHGRYS